MADPAARVFLLALGAATGIAAVDALLGGSSVIVELLVIAPLLAAAEAGPRRTAVVAAYAVALAIPLGFAADSFGDLDHLTGVVTVLVGGALAVVIARLRAQRDRESTGARDQLEAILRGVADSVTAQAPDGTLLFANDAAAEMLGFDSPQALLDAPLDTVLRAFDVLDERGEPLPVERLPGRRALAEGVAAEELIRFRIRETGEERWSMVKATPIHGADGRVTMAINVIEDITAHKRAETEQRLLAEAARVLATSGESRELLRGIAELAVPDIADWCSVDLVNASGAVERVALAHHSPALAEEARELQERYPPDPSSPEGVPRVLRTGESVLYEELSDDVLRRATRDESQIELLRRFELRSALIVPMATGGRVLGALSIVSGPSGRRFDERDVELAEELGRRCATAVDNARLMGERSYIAKTLQASLLPVELPEIPGIESAARFRPTGEGNEVGGDFYDLFETAGRGWTIVVGDVCGKGPDAAAVTALARYTLRAAAMRERLPSRSLRVLNEALLRQRRDRRFCTVAYAYLEATESGARVGFASGGHPLPLVLRADGAVEPLGAYGTLLGVVPDPDLEDRSATLASGDALVFYTDGVTDARSGSLSDEDLAGIVASCAGTGADTIAARLEAAAVEAQGGQPFDDIAVLVVRVVSGRQGAAPT